MKVNLQQALTGKSLRNDIFTTIGHRPLHSLSTLLRRSRQRNSRYLPYSSQDALIHAESPIGRANLSNPLTASPPLQLRRAGKGQGKQNGGKFQRTTGRQVVASKSKNKSSNKSNSKHPLPSQPKKGKGKTQSQDKHKQDSQSPSRSRNNPSSRGKSSQSHPRKSTSSRRSHKSRLDLSSIIQHTNEQVITPSSRANTRRDISRRSPQKTHKKQQRMEALPQSICRRIDRMSSEPGKFLRVMKNETMTVRVRVQRRRIIQLEILTLKVMNRLSVILERGNLDCQHIQERYLALPAGSRLALFSCVRAIDIDHPAALSSLHLQGEADDGTQFDRHATLPYTWLLFTSEGRLQTKSRIVTKACLDGANVDTQRLKTLARTLPCWTSRHMRGESMLCSQFSIVGQGFSFVVREAAGFWSLQVVGRGQSRLQGLLAFLSAFLRPS